MWCCARETGWPEHYIRWELHLSRLLQYEHLRLLSQDYSCYPAGSAAAARGQFDSRMQADAGHEDWLELTPDA